MKVLLLYDYPASPSGLATQGELLYRGLKELNVEVHAVHFESELEKEWYYRWFKPDVVVGIGYWGHTPKIILHPQQHGMLAVPWLVADGYIANYQEVLNALPLILVTSNWVKEMYVRDGIRAENILVLPVGCDTETFKPRSKTDPKVLAARAALGISPNELLILTVGGDAASKGGREVLQALAEIKTPVPSWKYLCKVWPQPRTELQNSYDLQLADELGIGTKVKYVTNVMSRQFAPYLLAACDIYAAPSRLEGFGMIQVEAGACGKPVIGIHAMGMLDTLVHGETAFLAEVGERIVLHETTLGSESGFEENRKVIFDVPRTVDYRANVSDIRDGLVKLLLHENLRQSMGEAGRKRVVEHFDYRVVASKFIALINERLGIY